MIAPDEFIIVDDDVSNNYLCQSAIRVLFPECPVRLFNNPEEALKTLSQRYAARNENRFIILFLDINMPQMNGWTFLEQFAKLNTETRRQFVIYMLTSSIDPLDREKSNSNPEVTGFLSKPLIVKELRALLSLYPGMK